MSHKISITLGKICNGAFTPALGKLCSLTVLSGKDTYALMRTMDQLEPELTAYQKALASILKKHGARSSIADLRDAAKLLEERTEALSLEEKQTLEDLRKKIQKLEPFERLEISPTDAGWENFTAERKELDARPVELFMNHKIHVPLEKLPPGTLNAFDMRELTSLATFEERPANA
ncbi:MAG TPA: hypothetical protein VGY56_11245 [Verrucomicrobiae bacterium]|nr:hypothetical protein [Verrucomicrobiae bacterium]